jgi:hypothetical protein
LRDWVVGVWAEAGSREWGLGSRDGDKESRRVAIAKPTDFKQGRIKVSSVTTITGIKLYISAVRRYATKIA